jgi:hypothetical protein
VSAAAAAAAAAAASGLLTGSKETLTGVWGGGAAVGGPAGVMSIV